MIKLIGCGVKYNKVHFKGKFNPKDIKELISYGELSDCMQNEFIISVDDDNKVADIVKTLVLKGNDIYEVSKVIETVKEIYFRIIGGHSNG